MRLLLITYYFPPCGGAAVQRWLKWLPDLVEAGFEVAVLTSRDGDYPVLDESLLGLVPPQVKIIRARAPRLGKLWIWLTGGKNPLPHGELGGRHDNPVKKALVWLRLNLIIPDLRVFWNPSAFKSAQEFLRANPVDVVITTGPPHSTHLVGLKLKKHFKLPWVADWRDPWTSVYYLQLHPPSYIARHIHRRLESQVALMADANLMVSEFLANSIKRGRREVVYNGFDTRSQAKAGAVRNDRFRLKYVGSLTEGQDFGTLLEILEEAFTGLDFELSLVGTRLADLQSELLNRRLPGHFRLTGFLKHDEALQEMADSEVLILLINDYPGAEGMLTTKLFEYMSSGSKILCLGPLGGEAEKLIGSFGAGACFSSADKEKATAWLRELHAMWQSGQDMKNIRDVSSLSSQNQALKLISVLESIKKH